MSLSFNPVPVNGAAAAAAAAGVESSSSDEEDEPSLTVTSPISDKEFLYLEHIDVTRLTIRAIKLRIVNSYRWTDTADIVRIRRLNHPRQVELYRSNNNEKLVLSHQTLQQYGYHPNDHVYLNCVIVIEEGDFQIPDRPGLRRQTRRCDRRRHRIV